MARAKQKKKKMKRDFSTKVPIGRTTKRFKNRWENTSSRMLQKEEQVARITERKVHSDQRRRWIYILESIVSTVDIGINTSFRRVLFVLLCHRTCSSYWYIDCELRCIQSDFPFPIFYMFFILSLTHPMLACLLARFTFFRIVFLHRNCILPLSTCIVYAIWQFSVHRI